MLQLMIMLLVGSILLISHYELLSLWQHQANQLVSQWQSSQQVTMAATQWRALQSHYVLQCPNQGVAHVVRSQVLSLAEVQTFGFPMKASGSGRYVNGPIVLLRALGAPVWLPPGDAGSKTLSVPLNFAVQKRDQLLLSNCAQAQIIDIQKISQRSSYQKLQLLQAVAGKFTGGTLAYPLKTWVIYLGQAGDQTTPSLYVMTADQRRYEWISNIEGLSAQPLGVSIEVSLASQHRQARLWLSKADLY